MSDGSTLDVEVAMAALGSIRSVEWLEGSGPAAGDWGAACDAGCRAVDVNGGIHYCFGAPLARPETQIALTQLAHRLENPDSSPTHRPTARASVCAAAATFRSRSTASTPYEDLRDSPTRLGRSPDLFLFPRDEGTASMANSALLVMDVQRDIVGIADDGSGYLPRLRNAIEGARAAASP